MKQPLLPSLIFSVFSIGASVALAPSASAVSATYAGPTTVSPNTTSWNVSTSWNPNTVPGASGNNNDTALYATTSGGVLFTLDTTITLKSFTNTTGNRSVFLSNGTGGSLVFATTDSTVPTVNLTSTVDASVLFQFGISTTAVLTTDISQGLTINITGSKAATSQVRIISGSTFIGTGTFTQNGGVLAPQLANLLPLNNRIVLNGSQLALNSSTRNQNVRGLDGDSASSVSNFTNTGASILTLGNANTLATDTYNFAGVIGANTAAATPAAGTNISLVKAGLGTQTLSGASIYTGTTAVNGGTLSLTAAGTNSGTAITGGTLAATSGITISTGGTLSLNANNTVNPAATVGLAGGVFRVGGGALQGQGATLAGGNASGTNLQGVGLLTLTANSTLSFAGTSGTVVFSNLAAGTFTLNITGSNFGTVGGNSADGSTDRLIFGQDQASNISAGAFLFNGVAGNATEISLGGGFYEIVPTAVPEPSTLMGSILLLAVAGWHGLGLRARRRAMA